MFKRSTVSFAAMVASLMATGAWASDAAPEVIQTADPQAAEVEAIEVVGFRNSLARARALIYDAIARSDICLPSQDDLQQLSGLSDPDALADHCLRLGARTVALKLGAAGALVADAHERHRIAPHPCRSVDATGAGDTFGGAFVARRLAGDGLREAAAYAAVAAALSTEGFGAVAPIPDAAAVRRAMQQQETGYG